MENYLTHQEVQDILYKIPKSIPTGAVLQELTRRGYQIEGLDIPEKVAPVKRSLGEKIADVTGGKEISQGLGQAIAAPANETAINAPLNDAIKIQGDLVRAIEEKESRGEDTSRLKKALAMATDNVRRTGGKVEQVLNPNELTRDEIVGDALQLATTASAGKIFGAANKIPIKVAGAGTGALKGAVAGAVSGAPIGTLENVAQGLQENESGADLANRALEGAVGGAVAGGALGGVTGAVGGAIKARQARKLNFTENLVTPKLDKNLTETAIKTGRVTESTGLTGQRSFTEAIPNLKNVEASVKQVPGISPKKTLLQNSNTIHDEIGRVAEDLKTQIKDKGFFSPNEFNGYMNGVKKELAENPLIVGDAEKTATKIVDKFNSLLQKNGYTPEGLLESRKQLDQWMQLQKGSAIFDPAKENAVSIALRAIRQGGNDFLAQRVPDAQVKQLLAHQANLYQAIENIAPKAAKEGESWIRRFFSTRTGRIVRNVAVIGGSAAVGAKVVNASQ